MNLYTDYIRKKLADYGTGWGNDKHLFNAELNEVFKYWHNRTERINKLADHSPTHYEYLKENIYEV
jgi:hypothetical protein